MEDEFDRLPGHIHQSGEGWIVGGGIPLAKLFATMGLPLPAALPGAAPQTLAQWTSAQLGRQPKGGDIIRCEEISVVVRKLRRHKVSEAFVKTAIQRPL